MAVKCFIIFKKRSNLLELCVWPALQGAFLTATGSSGGSKAGLDAETGKSIKDLALPAAFGSSQRLLVSVFSLVKITGNGGRNDH